LRRTEEVTHREGWRLGEIGRRSSRYTQGRDADLPTLAIFQKCVGHTFVITDFNDIDWAEIDIGSVTGSMGETIWVEPEFLELVSG
jgi:hypothetical protein